MTTPLARVHLDVFADYHQFYIWDPDLPEVAAPEHYTDADLENRVKTGPGVVVIQPIRNMTVPVDVEIFDADPDYHINEWQHIAEAPLTVTNHRIEIHECTGGSLALLPAPARHCTVRALFKGLDTLSENGLKGSDIYQVQIFPSIGFELRIVKKWP
jgi:hypothetical protein